MSNIIMQKYLDVISEGDLFAKYLKREDYPDNNAVEYACKKGLWSVYGQIEDDDKLQQQALHYFIQYYMDGEYLDD